MSACCQMDEKDGILAIKSFFETAHLSLIKDISIIYRIFRNFQNKPSPNHFDPKNTVRSQVSIAPWEKVCSVRPSFFLMSRHLHSCNILKENNSKLIKTQRKDKDACCNN